MTGLRPAMALVAMLLLAGCDEGVAPPLPDVQVALTAQPQSVSSSGGTVTLTCTVTEDGQPRSNVSVNFSSTAGSLDPTAGSTDSTGKATSVLTITNPTSSVTATATTSVGTASVTITVQ